MDEYGISKNERFGENPFIKGLKVKSKKKMNVAGAYKDKAIIDTKTYEVDSNQLFLASNRKVESEEFIKIFISNYRKFFSLTNSGIRVFFFLMNEMKFEDVVLFEYDKCIEYTGISKSSVRRGLIELLEAELIARTKSRDAYWINPSAFYKGNRLNLVTKVETDKPISEIMKDNVRFFNYQE